MNNGLLRLVRMSLRSAFAALIFLISLGVLTNPSTGHAEERIENFHVVIGVKPDASLIVTESIRVYAEGNQIKRGIFRDFPTLYHGSSGLKRHVGFDVTSVRRDGAYEPYTTKNLSNGTRIYIGSKNEFLPQGFYTYEITYRTTRQLRSFEDFDELYWNVTGNDWAFPIDNASVRVNFPNGAGVEQYNVYTGATGEQGRQFVVDRSEGSVFEARATERLPRGHGLTIAVGFTKGIVTFPDDETGVLSVLAGNLDAVVLWIGIVVLVLYCAATWHWFGRDPDEGAIVPLFEPPEGISPAAARLILLRKSDHTSASAALVSLAVKGHGEISESTDGFVFRRTSGATGAPSSGEREWLRTVDTGGSLHFGGDYDSRIETAMQNFKNRLIDEHEDGNFRANRMPFMIAIALGIAIAIVSFIVAAEPWWPPNIAAMGICAAIGLVVYFVKHSSRSSGRSLSVFRAAGLKLGILVLKAVFVLIFAMGSSIMTSFVEINLLYAAGAVGLVGTLLVYEFLIEAPTDKGTRLRAALRGFQHYLSMAEQDRLDKLTPPDMTPERFERLLPYAIALNVETAWADKFDAAVQKHGFMTEGPDGNRHNRRMTDRFRWYRRSGGHQGYSRNMATSIASTLPSRIDASSTEPASTSSGSGGFSGGGFSGGGGGGGGGGGW